MRANFGVLGIVGFVLFTFGGPAFAGASREGELPFDERLAFGLLVLGLVALSVVLLVALLAPIWRLILRVRLERAALALVLTSALICLALGAPHAFAQTATADSTISAKPLVDFVTPYILAILGTLITAWTPFLLAKLNTLLHISTTNAQEAMIEGYAKTMAGKMVAAAEDNLANQTFHAGSPEIVGAVDEVMAMLPAAAKAAGITPDAVETKLLGEIGKLQAQQPPAAPVGAALKAIALLALIFVGATAFSSWTPAYAGISCVNGHCVSDDNFNNNDGIVMQGGNVGSLEIQPLVSIKVGGKVELSVLPGGCISGPIEMRSMVGDTVEIKAGAEIPPGCAAKK